MRSMSLCSLLIAGAIAGCSSTAEGGRDGHTGPSMTDGDAFVTAEEDGRIWVFRSGSDALADYRSHGEPAKSVTLIGVGPGGKSVRSVDTGTIIAWLAAKPGWHTEVVDERLWVLEAGSKSLEEFQAVGEPAKSITMIGAGPQGMSVRSDSLENYYRYKAAKPGYAVYFKDDILWVFAQGSEAQADFLANGEPGKNATRIAAGPDGVTVRSDSLETIDAWMVAAPGFNTYLRDGRIWVFEPGSEAEQEFLAVGEPAKNATAISAGPDGRTVKSVDMATIEAYLRAVGS